MTLLLKIIYKTIGEFKLYKWLGKTPPRIKGYLEAKKILNSVDKKYQDEIDKWLDYSQKNK